MKLVVALTMLLSSMHQLSDTFEKASTVTPACLAGTWVEIETVSTEQYLTGREGPDRRRFDLAGLQRLSINEGVQQTIWEWRLVIKQRRSRWIVQSSPAWSHPTTTELVITPEKELLLDAQFDFDIEQHYRCRCAPDRLICLLRKFEDGNGVVFRRR